MHAEFNMNNGGPPSINRKVKDIDSNKYREGKSEKNLYSPRDF
jgi:hypothetical protein